MRWRPLQKKRSHAGLEHCCPLQFDLQQYPEGNNPDDTADTLGQKIDDMYDAQDAFQKDCGPIDAFSRGSKATPPGKSNLKINSKR